MTRRHALDRDRILGVLVLVAIWLYVAVIFWVTAFQWSQGRWDYFQLADAFLGGRTWIEPSDRIVDRVTIDGRTYLPFAPFPAVVLVPLVWLFGVGDLLPWEQTINVIVAAGTVVLCWVLLGRVESLPARTRVWLTGLFAFSTPVWWVSVLGGPWHFAQLLATALTLLALIEVFGARRPWLVGIIAAAGFLTRPTLLFAIPFYMAAVAWDRDPRRWPGGKVDWKGVVIVIAPVVVAILLSFGYNAIRFGSPLESGYALAALPPELAGTRDHGLFSLVYLPRNLDYLLTALPVVGTPPWILHPSGYGLSLLITSPAIALALFARYGRRINVLLAATAVAVLLPSLLYYGGGWFQLGFRYLLDSVPFVMVLVASGASRRFSWRWKVLIGFGAVVSLLGILWAYSVSYVPAS